MDLPFKKGKGASTSAERVGGGRGTAGKGTPRQAGQPATPRRPGADAAAARLEKLSRSVFIGTFVAIAAVGFGVVSIASSQATVQRVTGDMQPVVVAQRDIAAGTTISPDSLTLIDTPATFVSSGSITSLGDVSGKTACIDIPANTQMTSSCIADAANASSLSAKLEPGFQAVTVSVGEDTGLSSLLRCGDVVDVYAARDAEVPALLASDVKILALGNYLSGPASGSAYTSVSLMVDEGQATSIIAAEQAYDIVLTLHPLSEKGRS